MKNKKQEKQEVDAFVFIRISTMSLIHFRFDQQHKNT